MFCTGPAVRATGPNLITEIIGTAVLLFGILAIAANAQTLSKPGDVDLTFVFSRGLQPLLVGVLVLGIGLSLGGPTGYAINPARDLGPRLAARRAADTRQGRLGLGVFVDTDRGTADWRRRRRGVVRMGGF